jgi:NmrA-like family
MKDALAGVDVVISTISYSALGVQVEIAKAAKEAGVKLFVPSEFGGVKASPEETEGFFGEKVGIRGQLEALSLPYTIFHTGIYSDYIWRP